ncbi:hypothetical protein Pcinc_018463 [Petrolisthes cinctipes]|uniref:Uncharacterized protein n=1 Tax=Petrolisthes cinctipes TaxID=88211 RepID=A0AAE1KJ31_PETCI|nr:hypothetical protein Pcinc_018463 [Petrolisthes cinctipes]
MFASFRLFSCCVCRAQPPEPTRQPPGTRDNQQPRIPDTITVVRRRQTSPPPVFVSSIRTGLARKDRETRGNERRDGVGRGGAGRGGAGRGGVERGKARRRER